MTLLRKAGSGSVDPVIFNDVVDAEQNGSGGLVTAADIDSQAAANGDVLTANGAGGATFAASPAPSFATPAVALGASAVAGTAGTVIRSDSTIVAFDSTAPTTQAFADAASVGTAAVAARRDHKHAMMAAPTTVSGNAGTATALATSRNIDGQGFDGTANITVIAPGTHAATSKNPPVDADEIPLVDSAASNVLKKLTWANLKATIKAYTDTLYPSGSGTSTGSNTGDVAFATNAVVLGTAAAAGAASTVMRSNDTIAAFDATSPSTQAIGDSAVVGVATVAARRDHKHAMPAFATNAIVLGASAAAGSAATLIHSDDTIAAFDTTVPTTQAFGDAAAVGTAAFAARRDHKHAMPATPREQLQLTALGLLTETFPIWTNSTVTAPTSQSAYGAMMALQAGDSVTGIMLRLNVAAAGTAPTTARFGIANSAGVIVAISSNLNTASNWTIGPCGFPVSYSVPTSGGYYAVFVVNGTWGSTQPTMLKSVTAGAAYGQSAFGANPVPSFVTTGQTDLPSVSASISRTAQPVGYYMAFY